MILGVQERRYRVEVHLVSFFPKGPGYCGSSFLDLIRDWRYLLSLGD